jgi:hypothetical protein
VYAVPLSQMPLNSRMSLMELTQSAVVDLQESSAFNEPFYVVVVEKENDTENRQNESFGYLDNKKNEKRTKIQPSDSLEGK